MREYTNLRRLPPGWSWVYFGTALLLLNICILWSVKKRAMDVQPISHVAQPTTLAELFALPIESLERVDIARRNLLCAQGLPGADDLNVNASLAMLDQMAARVRSETARHLYRFREHPAEFERSESFFRMVMMAVVLAEDFGIHYAAGKKGTAAEARLGDGFFADSSEVFLHGLIGSKRAGTCSSLPVLQVAVGRRLGYPLKLVTTKGHLFVRWENEKERFNVEATGQGVNRFPDDYYRHWPMEVSAEEIEAEGYLKSLTPEEELAVFLSIRGMCYQEKGLFQKAAECFGLAVRLAPGCRSYATMQAELERRANGSMAVARTQ